MCQFLSSEYLGEEFSPDPITVSWILFLLSSSPNPVILTSFQWFCGFLFLPVILQTSPKSTDLMTTPSTQNLSCCNLHPHLQAPTAPQLSPSLKARDLPFLSGIHQHFPASGHLLQDFFNLEVTSPHTQLSETAHPSLKTQFTLFPVRTQGCPSLVCKDQPLLFDCERLGDWDLWFLPKALTLFWSLLADDSQNVLSLSSLLPFTFSVTPSLFSRTVPAGPCIFQGLWGLQGRAILMTS